MPDLVLITSIDANGVARLTMNRPDLRNAFNEELIAQICETMGRLNSDPGVRVIILTGAGKAFSAGADLNMMKRVANYSAAENRDDARRLAHMLAAIYHSNKPTIAQVNGPAMGGGLGLISACDIAIGADSAFFSFSEVRLGLIPAVISPFVIQAIGARNARRYFTTAEKFDARTAVEMGLLHMAVPDDALSKTVGEMADALLAVSPEAAREAKMLVREIAGRAIDENLLDDTATRIAKIRASRDGREGVTAVLEKRKPLWVTDK